MPHVSHHYKTAKWLTESLDSKFKVGPFKFGLDPIIGLIPWFGDLAGLILSLYIFWIGVKLRIPFDKLAQMLGNIALDFMLGIIPLVGDIADFTFKSNTRNLKILSEFAPGDILEGEIV